MNIEAIATEAAKWLPLIVLVASLVNAFTDHYGKHKSWVKALLAVVERLSVLSSSDTRKDGKGALKVPLTSKEPSELRKRVRAILATPEDLKNAGR